MYRSNRKLYRNSSFSIVMLMMMTSIERGVPIRATQRSLRTEHRALPLRRTIISMKIRSTLNCRPGQPRLQPWFVPFSANISDARRTTQASQPRVNPRRRSYLPSIESSITWINRTQKIRQSSPKKRTCWLKRLKSERKRRRTTKWKPRFPQSIEYTNVEFFLVYFLAMVIRSFFFFFLHQDTCLK